MPNVPRRPRRGKRCETKPRAKCRKHARIWPQRKRITSRKHSHGRPRCSRGQVLLLSPLAVTVKTPKPSIPRYGGHLLCIGLGVTVILEKEKRDLDVTIHCCRVRKDVLHFVFVQSGDNFEGRALPSSSSTAYFSFLAWHRTLHHL